MLLRGNIVLQDLFIDFEFLLTRRVWDGSLLSGFIFLWFFNYFAGRRWLRNDADIFFNRSWNINNLLFLGLNSFRFLMLKVLKILLINIGLRCNSILLFIDWGRILIKRFHYIRKRLWWGRKIGVYCFLIFGRDNVLEIRRIWCLIDN